jgi:hypothetical protein
VLIATEGPHKFRLPIEQGGEGVQVCDCREKPIKFASYAISYRGGHACVRIEEETERDLKAYFADRACHNSVEELARDLHSLPFEPYAPIRGQFFQLLRSVNRKRRAAQLELVPSSCLRLTRKIYRPFDVDESCVPAAA